MTLILSIVALLIGPAIYAAGRQNRIARRALDGLILLAIAVIIAVHVVPEALRQGGQLAFVVILLGLAFPALLERLFRSASDTAHQFIVALAATGPLIHAVVDGVGLLPESGTSLAYAIVLHRLPVGMAIWCVVRPNFGTAAAVSVFILVIAATVVGYFLGAPILELAETRTVALFQAFIAGSLIHVVIFRHAHHH